MYRSPRRDSCLFEIVPVEDGACSRWFGRAAPSEQEDLPASAHCPASDERAALDCGLSQRCHSITGNHEVLARRASTPAEERIHYHLAFSPWADSGHP